MGRLHDIIDGLKPVIMMVVVYVTAAGVNILYKLAGTTGMSLSVMVAYRFLFAAATIVPLALVLERKNRPRLTWKIVLLAFGSALFGGSLAQNLYAKSMMLTSATFVTAIYNIVPALTFILAIIFRMEVLGLKTMAGKAKIIGTFLSIGGAMLLTLYKGCKVNIFSTHFDLLHDSQLSNEHVSTSKITVLGFMLAIASCFCVTFGFIVQAKLSSTYPSPYSSTALTNIMGSLQSVVYAFCVERDWSQWKLGWNLRLLTCIYMGVLASGIMWVITMATVRTTGPLFVSIFSPLLLVLVAIAGSLFLNEQLYLGSVLGSVVIVCGLYLVLWGKSIEMKEMKRLMPSKSFKEGTTAAAAAGDRSFKVYNVGSNVVVVTHSLIPESEIIDVCDDDDDDEDQVIEEAAKVSSNESKP